MDPSIPNSGSTEISEGGKVRNRIFMQFIKNLRSILRIILSLTETNSKNKSSEIC